MGQSSSKQSGTKSEFLSYTFTLLSYESSTTEIKATDIPQWLWTNSQCREWVTEVLIHFCEKDRIEAKELADKVIGDGFGPRIFKLDEKMWEMYLGEIAGGCVFDLVFTLRQSMGAVPPGFTYFYEESTGKDGEGDI